jgi:UDP-N-acetylglucosamine diphosphorylase / glucose-1-phosphate thymidylyltransferase / UDP-N-acetylgalactosamine diphosphorylase / glucosamine-1-phosphate N-acetyltransferase / galactosamine-1-phosphate N-acetyltransferase
MFEKSEKFYDAIYAWKDYKAEAMRLKQFIAIKMQEFVQRLLSSPLSSWCDRPPWSIVTNAEEIVQDIALASLEVFERRETTAVHPNATIEARAVVKGPAVIGTECFIANGAYLRDGLWLDERCNIGPGSELKSSFLFSGSKLAHLNFVGDTILGSEVNLETGCVIANHRNERIDKQIRVIPAWSCDLRDRRAHPPQVFSKRSAA